MKEYKVQQKLLDGPDGWCCMDRAAYLEMPWMDDIEKARKVFRNVIASANENGLNASNYRLVERDVTEWSVVDEVE